MRVPRTVTTRLTIYTFHKKREVVAYATTPIQISDIQKLRHPASRFSHTVFIVALISRKALLGDFSLSLIPQNLMSQKRGWRDFSAHSRNCKPFQLFCIAPKSKLSPASDLKNTQTSLTIHPPSIFVKNTQKNAALVTFYANRLCIAYPPTTELSLGSPQGKS